jgi:hypothetical protein
VEEEMLVFLGLIINMGVIHLPHVKDYWSQQFAEFLSMVKYLQGNAFFRYFGCCIWRRFPLLATA